jgi:hypothetical protein
MTEFIYVVLVFLILRFSVTVFNFLSNPKLGHYGKKFDDKVSIIIYSSNGESEQLIQSIADQDYHNVEVLKINSKEDLIATASAANGRYLLVLEADCIIYRGLLNSLIYRTKVFELKSIVLIPGKIFNSFNDYLLQPLADYVILNVLPLRLIRLLNLPSLAAAGERFLFYDSFEYKLEHSTNEKSAKKVETLLANGMIVSNRKTSVKEITRELVKIFEGNLLGVSLYLLLSIAGPIILILNFEPAFIVLPIGLIFLTRIMISFLTRQNPIINVLLHPLQMVALTGLLVAGTFKKLFTSGIHSKQ